MISLLGSPLKMCHTQQKRKSRDTHTHTRSVWRCYWCCCWCCWCCLLSQQTLIFHSHTIIFKCAAALPLAINTHIRTPFASRCVLLSSSQLFFFSCPSIMCVRAFEPLCILLLIRAPWYCCFAFIHVPKCALFSSVWFVRSFARLFECSSFVPISVLLYRSLLYSPTHTHTHTKYAYFAFFSLPNILLNGSGCDCLWLRYLVINGGCVNM